MNVDQTAISVPFFAVLQILVWALVILFAVKVARGVANKYGAGMSLFEAFQQHFWGITFCVVFTVCALIFYNLEGAYRPKTTSALPPPPRDDSRNREPVELKRSPERETFEQQKARNREANQAARASFEALSTSSATNK